MNELPTFKCPKCGGRYFGTKLDPETRRIIGYDCHNNIDGTDAAYEGGIRLIDGKLHINRGVNPPCGWSGTEDQCA